MIKFKDFLSEGTSMGYTAYTFSEHTREEILKKFPPKNNEVIAHHITWKFLAKSTDELPPIAHEAHIVGYASEDGLEALVVSINGTTKRPDGAILHITLSLDRGKGKKPVHSNQLLKNGYSHVTPFSIQLEPTFLK